MERFRGFLSRRAARPPSAIDDDDVDATILRNIWKQKRLLPPTSLAKERWEAFMFVLVFYNCIYIPLELSFTTIDKSIAHCAIDYLVDILFVIDMVINFRTTYYDENNELVMVPRSIALRYVRRSASESESECLDPRVSRTPRATGTCARGSQSTSSPSFPSSSSPWHREGGPCAAAAARRAASAASPGSWGDTGADSDAQAKVLSDLNARVEKVSSDVQQVHCASAPTESGRPLPSGFADQFNHLTSLPGGDGDEAGEGQPASALRGRGAHGERRVIPRSTRRCEGLGAA